VISIARLDGSAASRQLPTGPHGTRVSCAVYPVGHGRRADCPV